MPAPARLARAAAVATVFAAYFGYVLKIPQGTAFTTGLGDWLDPYFINALLEHWYSSLTHLTSPASPPFFFPQTGMLGYSHGLVLYAPFYAIVRPFAHPFVAYTLTLFLVMETGALCLFGIFRRFAGLGFAEAVLLTAFFCASPNIINGYTGTWSQVASVFLIPPILLLGLTALRMPPGRTRLAVAALSGLLASLLMTQDAYTGLFAFLLAGLLLMGVMAIEGVPATIRRVRRFWQTHPPSRHPWRRRAAGLALGLAVIATMWTLSLWAGALHLFGIESHHHHIERPGAVAMAALAIFILVRGGLLSPANHAQAAGDARGPASGAPAAGADLSIGAAYAIGGVAGGLVFLWIYFGPSLEHRGFPEEQLLRSLQPRQLSGPIRDLIAYQDPRPFYLVLLAAIAAWVPRSGVRMRIRAYGIWVVLVSAFVALAALSLDGVSVWKTVFTPLPGFAAIRDPKRIVYAYELAVALLAGGFLGLLPKRSPLRIAVMLVVLWSVASNPNLTTFTFKRPIETFDRWVRAPLVIDPSCRSFFMKAASEAYTSRSGHQWSLYGVDATFIAMDHRIPTVNGYSAWTPDKWYLANPADRTEYPAEVPHWIELHALQHVCVLDIDARTMTPFDPARPPW